MRLENIVMQARDPRANGRFWSAGDFFIDYLKDIYNAPGYWEVR